MVKKSIKISFYSQKRDTPAPETRAIASALPIAPMSYC